jgi:hypothetical protein
METVDYIGCKFVYGRGNAQNSYFKVKAEGGIGKGELGRGTAALERRSSPWKRLYKSLGRSEPSP